MRQDTLCSKEITRATDHRELFDGGQRAEGAVSYGNFGQVHGRVGRLEQVFRDVWLTRDVLGTTPGPSEMKARAHDVSSRITLPCQVQGSRGKAWEDLDKI